MNKEKILVTRLVRTVYPEQKKFQESSEPIIISPVGVEYKEIKIDMEKMPKVISFQKLVDSLPAEELERTPIDELFDRYQWEVGQLESYGERAQMPECVMIAFHQAGSQFIAEFWVNDLYLPKENSYNWHLQNTSQWKYAGCILVQDGRVSTHH